MTVIGGSAGSLDVLLYLLPLLKKKTRFAIIIVLHRKTHVASPLASLLSSKTDLPVFEVEDKQKILPGHIYLAPADYHLLIEKNQTFSLDVSEKVHFSRPSIDICFETAAETFTNRLTGILLSGANADGVYGLKRIRECKGIAIAQEPSTASVSFMPSEAIRQAHFDLILTPEEMTTYLNSL